MHADVKYLPQLQDEDKRRYVFVAIARATHWVFITIKQNKVATLKNRTILTDNGKEFTDRLFGSCGRQHELDQLCQDLDIEHRLTKPKTPQTNGIGGVL